MSNNITLRFIFWDLLAGQMIGQLCWLRFHTQSFYLLIWHTYTLDLSSFIKFNSNNLLHISVLCILSTGDLFHPPIGQSPQNASSFLGSKSMIFQPFSL